MWNFFLELKKKCLVPFFERLKLLKIFQKIFLSIDKVIRWIRYFLNFWNFLEFFKIFKNFLEDGIFKKKFFFVRILISWLIDKNDLSYFLIFLKFSGFFQIFKKFIFLIFFSLTHALPNKWVVLELFIKMTHFPKKKNCFFGYYSCFPAISFVIILSVVWFFFWAKSWNSWVSIF